MKFSVRVNEVHEYEFEATDEKEAKMRVKDMSFLDECEDVDYHGANPLISTLKKVN